ncbi:MAG: ATP-binding protein, partial [Eubacteriaceae bacterium]
ECLDILNSIRYGKNNYVWIHTFDPNDISKATILAHPNKNFVNKEMGDFIDIEHIEQLYFDGKIIEKNSSEGRSIQPVDIFTAFNEKALDENEGFVSYYWPKIIDGKATSIGFPKISFIKYFKPWKLVLGSGEYADFIDKQVRNEYNELIDKRNRLIIIILSIFSICFIIMVVLTSFITRSLSKKINDYQDKLIISTEKFRESERRLYDIASISSDIIWEIDEGNNYSFISGQTEKILGYNNKKLLKSSIFNSMKGGLNSSFKEKFVKILNQKKAIIDMEQCFETFDSQEKIILINANPVLNQENVLLGYRGVYRDITEIKKDEQRKAQLERELQQAQKMEAIGTMAAGIAHEINTPLQFIGDNIKFIDEGCQNIFLCIDAYNKVIEDKEHVAQIKNNYEIDYLVEEIPLAVHQSLDGLAHIRSIVSAMKDFSYQPQDKKEFADINHALETALIISRNEWKHWAEAKTEFTLNLPLVSCYIGEIKQAILNLIINASYALKERFENDPEGSKGSLILRTKLMGDGVVLEVEDTGSGIPESIRHRIFEPFFTTKEVGKGMGQGLAHVYNAITVKHRGKISFKSEVGKGTIFTIKLPTD